MTKLNLSYILHIFVKLRISRHDNRKKTKTKINCKTKITLGLAAAAACYGRLLR